jgi:hypothetical protein
MTCHRTGNGSGQQRPLLTRTGENARTGPSRAPSCGTRNSSLASSWSDKVLRSCSKVPGEVVIGRLSADSEHSITEPLSFVISPSPLRPRRTWTKIPVRCSLGLLSPGFSGTAFFRMVVGCSSAVPGQFPLFNFVRRPCFCCKRLSLPIFQLSFTVRQVTPSLLSFSRSFDISELTSGPFIPFTPSAGL